MTKKEVLRAIRLKCLDCCCGQENEVKLCEIRDCPLYLLRFGKDPNPSKTRSEITSKRFKASPENGLDD